MHIHAPQTRAVIFDLETVPDRAMIQRAIDLPEDTIDPVTAAFGDRFLPAMYHEVVAISALRLNFNGASWDVEALGAPSQKERSEQDLIRGFLATFDTNKPTVACGFNTTSFDLNVLRYRALLHGLSARGLNRQRAFYRYGQETHLDLCDVLSGFDGRSRITLDATCRALRMPGKLRGMDGSQVADFISQGRFEEIEVYAIRDVLATTCLWLRYALFTGALKPEGHDASLRNIARFIADRPQKFDPDIFAEFLTLGID